MEIQLIDTRNKRLKNKIARYNSIDKTWTIGKSKKVYTASFSYKFYCDRKERKTMFWYNNNFDEMGNLKDRGLPVKEIENMRINGRKVQHEIRFYDVSLKGLSSGVVVDGFKVLEYNLI